MHIYATQLSIHIDKPSVHWTLTFRRSRSWTGVFNYL